MFVAPTPPSQVSPKLAGQLGPLEGIILRALEKDPSARYATMQELADAIAQAMDLIGTHGPSWPAPASPSQRPPRGIADELELPSLAELRNSVERASTTPPRSSTVRTVAMFVTAAVVLIAGAVIVASALGTSKERPTSVEAAIPPIGASSSVAAPLPQIPAPADTTTASATPIPSATEIPSHPVVKRPKPPSSARTTAVPELGPDPFLKGR